MMQKAPRRQVPPFEFSRFELAPISVELQQFVQELTRNESPGLKQKRLATRFPFAIEVPAVELDEAWEPIGIPFVTMSRNLSVEGLSLVHKSAITAPYLLIRLDQKDLPSIQMVVQKLRCRPLKGYFEIGAKFIAKIEPTQT
jgi:hypothetical protein